ncbi:nickel pincer cofactor biosynthesis protein LarC [Butyrivibrio sp. VCD2006]|uniref:nickel pincer cofactor biosynthesis protein LarC n=1 Tax=Butyrivibrio sp. VCD2006 TaxID=1280664 RepID=UPI000413D066|nr:nickel pincer cofactor biosynthesis protein LarC [Butyrivibrio sp. VCD2006]
MGTLYIECKMGAAGDMLSAALLDLCDNREDILRKLNDSGIPGVSFSLYDSEKCGVMGKHLEVKVNGEIEESEDGAVSHEDMHDHHAPHDHEHNHDHDHHHAPHDHEHNHDHDHHHAPHDHEHNHDHDHHHAPHDHEHTHDNDNNHTHDHDHHHDHHNHDHDHHHDHHNHDHDHHHVHRSMHDIEHIVEHLTIDESVKKDIINVYKLIAEAESAVHGMDVSEIHFHEVGSMDAIADITATCFLMNEINPERVVVSPIHVGSGTVKCAHGILPVPAPATAMLLRGIPSYSRDIKGELCTPTGAALLKYFADSFGDQPLMSVNKIGYGMGKKDFPIANCVRAFLGDENKNLVNSADTCKDAEHTDTVSELVCNLDDMTPEAIGFATERLMEEGALDVFTTAVAMKKNRPGVLLTVLCRESDKDEFVRKIFKYTTTIGIRESICKRYILSREEKVLSTADGDVRVKVVSGYGVEREKMEYEDLAAIARAKGVSMEQAKSMAQKNQD